MHKTLYNISRGEGEGQVPPFLLMPAGVHGGYFSFLPFLPFSHFFAFAFYCREAAPLNQARDLGKRCELSAGCRAELRSQMHL